MHNVKHEKGDVKEERLSMRHSFMVWVFGAVLGWVIAVVSVTTALYSTTETSHIAQTDSLMADKMEQIMPAAGKQE